jgi:hypothetical protein
MTAARAAGAGAVAAIVWGALEPLDTRLLRHDYSDVALLGKAVTRGRAWPLVGFAVHAVNGAVFGLAYRGARRRYGVTAFQLALVESTALFPLAFVVDRVHPARGSRGLAPLFSARGFVQTTARHALFGAVLGRLAGGDT